MSLYMNVYDGKLFKPCVEILHFLEGMGCGGYSLTTRDLPRMLP